MQKYFNLLANFIDSNIDVIVRKNLDRPCIFFFSGFYQSDGDAFVMFNKDNLIFHSRFRGDIEIETIYDLGYESHNAWKLSRNLNDRWRHQATAWIPIYQRLRLAPFDEVVKDYSGDK